MTLLCNATDPDTGKQLGDDEIVHHIIFLLFAAHDTTALSPATTPRRGAA